MEQQTKQIETLASECESEAYNIQGYMVQLRAVQTAVAQLMERIDEIQHKGWDKELGMAYLSISEIEQTVRLIDTAFYPLFDKMNGAVDKLHNDAVQLFDVINAKVTSDELSKATTHE